MLDEKKKSKLAIPLPSQTPRPQTQELEMIYKVQYPTFDFSLCFTPPPSQKHPRNTDLGIWL